MIAINLNNASARRALSPAPAAVAPAQPARRRAHARRARGGFTWALAVVCLVGGLAMAYVSEAAGATQASYRISALKAEQHRLLAEQEATRYAISLASSAGLLDADATRDGMVQAPTRQYLRGAENPIAMARPDDFIAGASHRSLVDQLAIALGRPTVAEAKGR
ncbi:MAG: hypothetical protein ACYDGR_06390 [Candidatus Dormibacteria bacterium]